MDVSKAKQKLIEEFQSHRLCAKQQSFARLLNWISNQLAACPVDAS